MESLIYSTFSYPSPGRSAARIPPGIAFASRSNNKHYNHKKLQLLKNLRHRRRTEPPPDFYPNLHPVEDPAPSEVPSYDSDDSNEDGSVVWESDEIEAITSLFQGRVPQKPGKSSRERPLPLPLPHKTRPLGLPTSKKLIRTHLVRSTRQPVSNQLYQNPAFLISLAREIRDLSSEENVATVLDQWARFLRKGSLSLTVRELGHMGLPRRALHVFSWVQNQPHLFPDDRILASAVEVLARAHEPSSDSDDSNEDGNVVWESDEIEAITSLFQGRIPQKHGKSSRERPLPLPLPHKTRPLGLPTSKKLIRTHLVRSTRQPVSNQLYQNPAFLISLAREIRDLSSEENVATVLDQWARFLRKGSLSLTVRELGHMGLPRRALHVFSWVQNQPHLFPDDRILASAVEVLARAHELKMPFDLDQFASLTSRSVYEAMMKGSIKGGNLKLASKLLAIATESKRTLDVSIYVKLILQLAKNPDKRMLVSPLLDELGEREDLELTPMDCTAVMKACTRLGKFDVVESLYDWFKHTGGVPSVVMYTTMVHSRYLEKRYRDAMGVVWEMEASNCLLDLPAYRVVIRLFVAMNDLSRTARYFSRLKECGIAPTYDIYREVVGVYKASGRLAKCREICREAEMSGFKMEIQK